MNDQSMKIAKKVVTEVTFRESTSTTDDIRYFKLKYESEGAGRFFVLTDDANDGVAIYLNHPDDFKMIWEAAKELWEQGSIYADSEGF